MAHFCRTKNTKLIAYIFIVSLLITACTYNTDKTLIKLSGIGIAPYVNIWQIEPPLENMEKEVYLRISGESEYYKANLVVSIPDLYESWYHDADNGFKRYKRLYGGNICSIVENHGYYDDFSEEGSKFNGKIQIRYVSWENRGLIYYLTIESPLEKGINSVIRRFVKYTNKIKYNLNEFDTTELNLNENYFGSSVIYSIGKVGNIKTRLTCEYIRSSYYYNGNQPFVDGLYTSEYTNGKTYSAEVAAENKESVISFSSYCNISYSPEIVNVAQEWGSIDNLEQFLLESGAK